MFEINNRERLKDLPEIGHYLIVLDGEEVKFSSKAFAIDYFDYEAVTASWSELGIYLESGYEELLQQQDGNPYICPNLFRR